MKHTAILGLVIGWLAGYSAMGKEVFREDFEKDDPSHGVPAAEAPGKPGEKETPSAQKVAGARALPYYDTQIVHGGKRSLCTMWCNKGLPNATQGVFTLWSYDNMSESAWRSLNVTFMGVVDGKPGTVNAHLSQISSVPYYCSSKHGSIHPDRVLWPIRRYKGWHCYQFVLPAGAGARKVQVYLDGDYVFTVPDPVTAFQGFNIGLDYGRQLWLDDISLNDDPNTFQPNWMRQPVEGIGTLALAAVQGERIAVPVTMNDMACMTGPVELRATLYDWYEQPLAKAAVTVPDPRNKRLNIPLDAPATDGLYWLKMEAVKGGETVGAYMVKTRISWKLPAPHVAARAIINLDGFWDFKPEKIGNDNGTLMTRDWQKMYVPWALPLGRLIDVQEATYKKQFTVPADWKGRTIMLAIHEPEVKATVSINGKKAGVIEWPGGKLDVTNAVVAGQQVTLSIFLETMNNAGMRKVLLEKMGQLPADYMQNRENRHGLCGDVTLESEPTGAKVGNVFIRSETEPKTLKLEAEVESPSAGETYHVRADVFDGGKLAKSFEGAPVKAGDAKTLKVMMESPWPEARLWNLGDPWLYRVRLTLIDSKGKALDTTLPEKFGFRSLQAQGRSLLLNGRKVALFNPPTTSCIDSPSYFTMMRANLYNWITSNHHSGFAIAAGPEGGRAWDDDFEVLDQLGLAGDIPAGCAFNRIIGPKNLQDDPDVVAMMNREMEYPVRRYRNHPSLVFYYGAHGGSIPNPGAMISGFLMDGRWLIDTQDLPEIANIFKFDRRVIDACHRYDPTRIITAQDAGNFGDSIHVTHYAGWMPNQEVADSNEIWVKYGTKPYLITEQDAPYAGNWGDQTRKGGHGAVGVVPYFMEWAAITHGDDAFVRTDLDLEQLKAYETNARKDYGLQNLGLTNIYDNVGSVEQANQSIYYRLGIERKREQILAWRTCNITAYTDWRGSEEPIGQSVHRDVFRDIVGYLGGDPAHLTEKSGNVRPGESLTKSFIGVSNGNADVPAVIRWKLSVADKPLITKEDKVVFKAGETTVTPFTYRFKAQDVGRGALEAVLVVDGREVCSDSLAVTVMQPVMPQPKAKIALIDPEFATRTMMERLGIPFTLLNFGEDLTDYQLVIVGRRAMSYERAYRTSGFDIARALESGINVLMMGQKEDVLRNRFGFRTEYIGSRFVYIRDTYNPIFKGLIDRDFRNWRGSASLVDPFQASRNESGRPLEANLTQWEYQWNDGKDHRRPFKWGDRGTVSTIVLHKPERGNFIPLLDCEFNLDYTPLMEYRSGNGRLMFCQVDIEGRTEDHFVSVADPVADTLFSNMVENLSAKPEPFKWNKLAYLGGPKGEALLNKLRVTFTKIATPADLRDQRVLVVGELTETAVTTSAVGIKAFAERGGTVLVLPQQSATLTRMLPFPCQVTQADVHQVLVGKKTNGALRALGNADFYWKGILPIYTLSGLPAGSRMLNPAIIAQVPQGKGSYILMTYSPDSFPYDRDRFLAAQAEYVKRQQQKVNETPEERQARNQREKSFNGFYFADSQRVAYRTLNRMLDNLNVSVADYPWLLPSAGAQASTLSIDLTGQWQICTSSVSEETPPPAESPRWKPITVPGYWKDQVADMKNFKGYVWYRKAFDCPDALDAASKSALDIGSVADEDWAYLNGQFIGHIGTDLEPNTFWFARRHYKLTPPQIQSGLLRKGANVLTVRVNNVRLDGGIWRGPVKFVYSIPQSSPDLANRRSPYIRQDIGIADDPYMYQGW